MLPHAIAALVLAALLSFGAFFLGSVAPHNEQGVPTAICVNSATGPRHCVE
jgi:hypothetical protein